MPSTSSSKRFPLLAVVASLVVATAVWKLLASGVGAGGGYADGRDLNGGTQSGVTVFYDQARIGSEFWVSLPQVSNSADRPLSLTKARVTRVPRGLKVVEYRAVSVKDMGGHAMAMRTGGRGGMPDPEKLHDYAGQPIRVKPKSVSDYYYMARIRVTAPVRENLTGCRFWYHQGKTAYRQDLDCDTEIRLGPPAKD
ncbi:hypothetical protein [Streptomyces sp. NPDC005435]|uniref:hypothetical protein n=1 Tax=Streptomyces sp. NPDC005435 TaxID=3154464 RepID=UPI00345657B6